jgi:hypothetical protein
MDLRKILDCTKKHLTFTITPIGNVLIDGGIDTTL